VILRFRRSYSLILLLSALIASPIATHANTTDATPPATPTAEAASISVYFLREERRGPRIGAAHRPIDAETADLPKSAIDELLTGPTQLESDAGLVTSVPADVQLLGLHLAETEKVATVDLSAAFAPTGQDPELTSLAQVVYTLTQFPEIERVAITIEGTPITLRDADGNPLPGPAARTDYDHLTPLIFLESPAPGDTIASPVRLWGTANTFEATFIAEIHDAAGTVLTSQVVTATSGSGVRGTFDVTIPFDSKAASTGQVVVYEISARDGARENEVVVPVTFSIPE
jgi:germination protein M